ncbi:MAG: hypothetical protein P8186_31795 [Anaerolineae bacterium]
MNTSIRSKQGNGCHSSAAGELNLLTAEAHRRVQPYGVPREHLCRGSTWFLARPASGRTAPDASGPALCGDDLLLLLTAFGLLWWS